MCSDREQQGGPPRLWRLTGLQYARTAAAFVAGRRGEAPALEDLPTLFAGADPTDRFSNLSASHSISDHSLRQAIQAASIVARHAAKLCDAQEPAECLRAQLPRWIPLVHSRPVRDGEVERYLTSAERIRGLSGDEDAVRWVVESLWLSPEALLRTERGPASDAASVVRLSAHEVARSLAYTLTDAPPDDELWQAAETGALDDDAEVARQVDRLIGTLAEHQASRRFLAEYLRYGEAVNVTQDPMAFPEHDASLLVDDTARFLQLLLAESGERDFLATLLTADFGIARRATQASYGLEGLPQEPLRVDLPPERSGILTQPAWLAAHASTGETHPIRRGHFISESLLCREIPTIPIDALPMIPEREGATMRERLAEHTQGTCAGCHALMDPLGLGFEAFDHFGRHRLEEEGRPVDATGTLDGVARGAGPFDGARELSERLAQSKEVEECFVRHAFRFWMGREEGPHDGCTLLDAHRAYEEEGSYRAMLRALLLSRSFLYRRRGETQ